MICLCRYYGDSNKMVNKFVKNDNDHDDVHDDEVKIVSEINSRKKICTIKNNSENKVKDFTSDDDIKIVHETNSSDKDSCVICLGNFNNRSFLNECFHAFCYYCILQWSEISQTCPLCKSEFRFIVHDVRSITDYKETHVNKDEKANIPPTQRAIYRQTVRYRTTQGANNNAQQIIASRTRDRKRKKAPLSESDTIKDSRIHVYANSLYSKELPENSQENKFRKASPEFFAKYPGTKHRLMQWVNNELEVLLYSNKDHILFVCELIWKLLDKYSIRSEEFQVEIKPFLFDKTNLFCHELYMFATSPFDMKTYLKKVQYDNTTAQLFPSRWDLSPVQYIGETRHSDTGDTISRTRWDDTPSPIHISDALVEHTTHVISDDPSDNESPQLLLIPKQTTANEPILIDCPDEPADEEPCLSQPTGKEEKQRASTPVFLSSDEMPPTPPPPPTRSSARSSPPSACNSPRAAPRKRENTPVYRYTSSSPESVPVKKSKMKGKGKHKLKKKKHKIPRCDVLSDIEIPSYIRVIRNESEPCSSKDLT